MRLVSSLKSFALVTLVVTPVLAADEAQLAAFEAYNDRYNEIIATYDLESFLGLYNDAPLWIEPDKAPVAGLDVTFSSSNAKATAGTSLSTCSTSTQPSKPRQTDLRHPNEADPAHVHRARVFLSGAGPAKESARSGHFSLVSYKYNY